jgi:hypothetical protein
MKQVRWTLIAWIAALSVGCVAHIDSSALSKTEADGGDAELPAKPVVPLKSSAADGDDAGAPAVAQRDASKPPAKDEDDAGPAGAMPAAGSASSPKPDAGAACDFRGLVQMKCSGAACHGGPSAGAGLDLTSAALPTRVEGRKGPATCASNLLIDKDNPTKSAIYLKVTGTTCGSQMPLTGTPLTSTEQACVLSWIEAL